MRKRVRNKWRSNARYRKASYIDIASHTVPVTSDRRALQTGYKGATEIKKNHDVIDNRIWIVSRSALRGALEKVSDSPREHSTICVRICLSQHAYVCAFIYFAACIVPDVWSASTLKTSSLRISRSVANSARRQNNIWREAIRYALQLIALAQIFQHLSNFIM